MAGYWLKLYTEILDDPKYYRLSDNAKLGMYELMLVAKKVGNAGDLPTLEDICFYTRRDESWWVPVIDELKRINFVTLDENGGDIIRKFEERQAAIKDDERQKKYREALHKEFKCNEPVTNLSRNVTESKSKSKSKRESKSTEKEVDGDCGELITEFVAITGIEYPRGRKAEVEWDAPLSALKVQGLTVADMRMAIQELDGKKYPILSPKSIYNACDLVMKRRKRKTADGYVPASATEYAGAVIR